MRGVDQSRVRKVPASDLATPRSGVHTIYVDHWWSAVQEDGRLLLLFYGSSPQCNADEALSRRLTKELWPDAESVQVPVTYVKHTCCY